MDKIDKAYNEAVAAVRANAERLDVHISNSPRRLRGRRLAARTELSALRGIGGIRAVAAGRMFALGLTADDLRDAARGDDAHYRLLPDRHRRISDVSSFYPVRGYEVPSE